MQAAGHHLRRGKHACHRCIQPVCDDLNPGNVGQVASSPSEVREGEGGARHRRCRPAPTDIRTSEIAEVSASGKTDGPTGVDHASDQRVYRRGIAAIAALDDEDGRRVPVIQVPAKVDQQIIVIDSGRNEVVSDRCFPVSGCACGICRPEMMKHITVGRGCPTGDRAVDDSGVGSCPNYQSTDAELVINRRGRRDRRNRRDRRMRTAGGEQEKQECLFHMGKLRQEHGGLLKKGWYRAYHPSSENQVPATGQE